MLTDLHVSPFYQNEFIYLGFSYFVDPKPQTIQAYNQITNQINEKHAEKFYSVFDKISNYFASPAKVEAAPKRVLVA